MHEEHKSCCHAKDDSALLEAVKNIALQYRGTEGALIQVLHMTQGIYGLVIAFLIVFKCGLFTDGMQGLLSLTVQEGAYYLMSALPIAVVGLISALKQARVSAAGINLLSKRPDQVGKAITSAALVETYAIFALLISVLLVLVG